MSRVTIPDKICPHCGGTEWMTYISRKRGKEVLYYRCYKKHIEYTKSDSYKQSTSISKEKYHKTELYRDTVRKIRTTSKYKETQKKANSKYAKTQKGKTVRYEHTRTWKKKYPDRDNVSRRRYLDRIRDELRTSYVTKVIVSNYGVATKDISTKLITIKKKQLCLLRKVKQVKQRQQQQEI